MSSMAQILQPRCTVRCLVTSLFLLVANLACAQEEELVNIRTVDPTIVVELRYATSRNLAAQPLYPPDMPALIRPGVMRKLQVAQNYLRARKRSLKIWDAYRPYTAQAMLWQLTRDSNYVADPADGRGSLHTWGVAVDATIVDELGQELRMPTDFDVFSPKAMLRYRGRDSEIARNLRRLQAAMGTAGFYGMSREWWHFVDKEWARYGPIPIAKPASVQPASAPRQLSSTHSR